MKYSKEEQIKACKQGIWMSKYMAIFNSIMAIFSFIYLEPSIGWIFFVTMLIFLVGWWSNEAGLKILEKMK